MSAGTRVQATVDRVVDGDTIRVIVQGPDESEASRILTLDTEESRAGSGKPETPMGCKAEAHASDVFDAGDTVTLQFPGADSLAAKEHVAASTQNQALSAILLLSEHVLEQPHALARKYPNANRKWIMIYTHVLNRGGQGVRSPADRRY